MFPASTVTIAEGSKEGFLNGNCLKLLLGVTFCDSFICRKKVSGDYEALNERLQTLPDQLSYDIMVGAV